MWDQVLIENISLAAIIVGSIYFERLLEEKARRRKERETKKKIINVIINDLENKLTKPKRNRKKYDNCLLKYLQKIGHKKF